MKIFIRSRAQQCWTSKLQLTHFMSIYKYIFLLSNTCCPLKTKLLPVQARWLPPEVVIPKLITSTKIFMQPNELTTIVQKSFPITPTLNPNPDGHWTTNNLCAMITEFGSQILMIFGSKSQSISMTIQYLAIMVQWNKTMELVKRHYTWPRVQTFIKVLYNLRKIQGSET